MVTVRVRFMVMVGFRLGLVFGFGLGLGLVLGFRTGLWLRLLLGLRLGSVWVTVRFKVRVLVRGLVSVRFRVPAPVFLRLKVNLRV